MVVDGSVIAHHSFTFFLVGSLRIPLEEMPLPLLVHIMVCLLPLPLLVESRGGHMDQSFVNEIIEYPGGSDWLRMVPEPSWNRKGDPSLC